MRRVRWPHLSLALSLGGIAVAGYLTLVAYDQSLLVCGIGSCATVQNSPYAKVAGVPIALLGLGMYVVLFLVGLVRWRSPLWSEILTSANVSVALAGTLYSAYLTYLELFVIHAICQWCVASALLVTGVLLTESWGLRTILRGELAETVDRIGTERSRRQQATP